MDTAQNGGGNGGERHALSRLLLGGRGWKEQNPPPGISESALLSCRKGQVLRAMAVSMARTGRRGKAQDTQLASCKLVLIPWDRGLEAVLSWLPTPSPPAVLKRSSRSQGWPRLCPRRVLEELSPRKLSRGERQRLQAQESGRAAGSES